MASEYLDHPDVVTEIDNIKDVVQSNLNGRKNQDPVSGFEKFFWVRAKSEEDRIKFKPSTETEASFDDGYWVCNLVLKGGGTLGLAHAGFVAALESINIRFAGLAGASAGSIVALAIAASRGSDLLKNTAPEIVAATAAVPLDWFIDGPRPIRMLIKHCLQNRSAISPTVWIGLYRAWRRLLSKRGLNQGNNFEQWLQGVMEQFGAPTIDKLNDHLLHIRDTLIVANADLKGHLESDLITYQGAPACEREQSAELLKLIASAMPIGMKFELPAQMKYLNCDPVTTSPAKLARMSMAIPAFFDPVEMRVNPSTWQNADFLEQLAGLLPSRQVNEYRALDRLMFLDGGMFANLPSDAFARNLSDIPTLVVPLVDRNKPREFMRTKKTRAVFSDTIACVEAMRFQRDLDAYLQRIAQAQNFDNRFKSKPIPRSFPMQVSPIATGDAHWLNFVMSATEKQELFLAGIKAARKFIERIK